MRGAIPGRERRISGRERARTRAFPTLTIPPAALVPNVSMPSSETVRARLLCAFPRASIDVTDLTGTRDHFQAVVVAPEFDGKSRIEQHQMVYAALGDWMGGAIHALALATRAPDASMQKTHEDP